MHEQIQISFHSIDQKIIFTNSSPINPLENKTILIFLSLFPWINTFFSTEFLSNYF